MKIRLLMLCLPFICCFALPPTCRPSSDTPLRSPDGRLELTFTLNSSGQPTYSVSYDGNELIKPSLLGFTFIDAAPLQSGLELLEFRDQDINETWRPVWGPDQNVVNRGNERQFLLQEKSSPQRRLNIIFRVYDDGLAFRYELPQQNNLTAFSIQAELTEFVLAGNYRAWWHGPQAGQSYERYEDVYSQDSVADIDEAHTPLTMATSSGLYLSIHEARLVNYAAMNLKKGDSPRTFRTKLAPWLASGERSVDESCEDNVKVKGQTPFLTPWRTIAVASRPGQLIESHLIENLNDPTTLRDTSWIKPMRYIGIWWELHLGLATWPAGPNHGATTAHTMEMIDFASTYGIDAVLVEGWNLGWETWGEGGTFNYTTAYPDYDFEKLANYANDKKIQIIVHNETGGEVRNYEEQLEEAFSLYESLELHSIKTGYVGGDIDTPHNSHEGQEMVNHFQRVVDRAAEHEIMVNVHEPVKPTGLSRTYPNLMSGEGVRGTEWDAFNDDGNSPEHTTIIPFTRMLAGPIDFTPGIFGLDLSAYHPGRRVRTTLAKQLALYVVIYSPMQMAADLIQNYIYQPAFEFIKTVPLTWDETRVLQGEIGDYVTIVRKSGSDWYLGSITDENDRELSVSLDFLERGQEYVAKIYADAESADWQEHPTRLAYHQYLVDRSLSLTLQLAPGGGQAIHFRPASRSEIDTLPHYNPNPAQKIVIHVQKPPNWSAVWLWYDQDQDGIWETTTLGQAPGDMTEYRPGWYQKELSSAAVEFVFNDGASWAHKISAVGDSNFAAYNEVWISLVQEYEPGKWLGKVLYTDPE